MTLLELSNLVEKPIEVTERKNPLNLFKFQVNIKNLDIVEGHTYRSAWGGGQTILEAINNYCKDLSNKMVTTNYGYSGKLNLSKITITHGNLKKSDYSFTCK